MSFARTASYSRPAEEFCPAPLPVGAIPNVFLPAAAPTAPKFYLPSPITADIFRPRSTLTTRAPIYVGDFIDRTCRGPAPQPEESVFGGIDPARTVDQAGVGQRHAAFCVQ